MCAHQADLKQTTCEIHGQSQKQSLLGKTEGNPAENM